MRWGMLRLKNSFFDKLLLGYSFELDREAFPWWQLTIS